MVIDNAEHIIGEVTNFEVFASALPQCCYDRHESRATASSGEQVYRLAALSVPPPGAADSDLAKHESVVLFLERAREIAPELSETSDVANDLISLCQRLEGIPLAIELAAARVAMFSLKELNDRLADRFSLLRSRDGTDERHRTLKQTIDWSYRLLTADEAAALSILAVFVDGFTLEACEAMLPRTEVEPAEILQSLIEKSFVIARQRFDSTRYHLLETIREFAIGKTALR